MSRPSVRSDQAVEAARESRRLSLGRAIRSARGELTQGELGAKLAPFTADGRPIPQTTISRWEKGLVDLSMEQVWDLEEALELTHGTLAMGVGYVRGRAATKTRGKLDTEQALRTDPALHPTLRDQAVLVYRNLVETSKVFSVAEAVETGNRFSLSSS